jgi:hypothetical protein
LKLTALTILAENQTKRRNLVASGRQVQKNAIDVELLGDIEKTSKRDRIKMRFRSSGCLIERKNTSSPLDMGEAKLKKHNSGSRSKLIQSPETEMLKRLLRMQWKWKRMEPLLSKENSVNLENPLTIVPCGHTFSCRDSIEEIKEENFENSLAQNVKSSRSRRSKRSIQFLLHKTSCILISYTKSLMHLASKLIWRIREG